VRVVAETLSVVTVVVEVVVIVIVVMVVGVATEVVDARTPMQLHAEEYRAAPEHAEA